ncbi:DNA replication licensing factor Mcm6, partial [Eumeta japonica]
MYYDHLLFKEDGEIKYVKPAADLESPDRCTLEVSFDDVEKYNQNLATTIIEEYYSSSRRSLRFTGTLIVVPDVGVLSMPGAKADMGSRHKPGDGPEGLTGLKAL